MVKGLRYGLQVFNYLVFVTMIWYFSSAPVYHHLEANQSVIILTFNHGGQLIGECRQRTPAELAKLAPNMRIPMDCPRRRSPIEVELMMDGQVLFHKTYYPSGLSGDGAVDIYEQFKVLSGSHQLRVRLKDSVKVTDFNYVHEAMVALVPTQTLVVDFKHEAGGFMMK